MTQRIILASGSEIRAQLLRNAGLSFDVKTLGIDEATIKESMIAEDYPPRDIADALAEAKALRVSKTAPGALVIGCDQVLDLEGTLLSKPKDRAEARAQLLSLRNKRHSLLSAAVICEDGKPIWRHIGHVRVYMRNFSEDFLDAYIERNWDSIQYSVGGYKLEEEGVRLMARIDGDYFSVLGLPLVELLNFLTLRGDLET